MLAAICFWDMFASGGAFNPGTAVVCCEMFPVNLPVALSVHRTTRKVFTRSILGVTVEYFPVIKEIISQF